MNKKLFIGLISAALVSSLNAECTNAPTGAALQKSIKSKNLDQSKQLLTKYNSEVKKFLASCKDEAKREEINLMKLTFEHDVEDLALVLKKEKEKAKIDCSDVPDDSALNKAFTEGNAETIKKTYNEYKKKASDYLDHCTSHEEYEFVFEASLLHDDEYANWESSAK